MQPIFVERPVLGDMRSAIMRCARQLGLEPEEDPHVTLIYSRAAVDWSAPVFQPDPSPLEVTLFNPRFARFGDHIVLAFERPELLARHNELRAAGATSDFPGYNAHITLGVDTQRWLTRLPAGPILKGPITFGPERCKVPNLKKLTAAPELEEEAPSP